jgi:UDP-N-acetylglucosamine--N-acetylmuramyl-(pentapeptide) pyrophosphoryl-undecaprenol N-acetylglucosamine transferase
MPEQNQILKVLLTGGGTGGHVFPALAVADAIKAMYPGTQFLFVGAEGRMEMERVPQAGYEIVGLPVAGIQRGFSWRSLQRNISFPIKLLRSSRKARGILRSFQPDVVIGTGGYASGPVMRAAQRMGIPTLIQEQNSFPGVTNRLLAKQADRICVAYDGMEKWFPADKIVHSGNPVRQDILNLKDKKAEGQRHFGLDPQRDTIYLTGGSLGARTLNDAVVCAEKLLGEPNAPNLIWQCGRYYYEMFKDLPVAALPNVHILPFVDRADLAYAAADIVVSRAGALTISELCIVGVPAVLVPSPNVSEDHQTKNALALTQIGAARIVRDVDAAEKLIPETLMILGNDALSFGLSESIRSLGKPDAAHVIAEEAINICKKK